MKKLIHSFTARKILELLLTLLIVTFLSFLLVKLSPVDAAEAYARRTFMLYTPEQLDELREEMGLNQPLLVQYGTWVGDALHLDFGTSLVNGRSVLGEVSRAMGVTLSIVLIAAVIEAAGILLGRKPVLLVQAEMGAPAIGFCVYCGRIHPAVLPCQFLSRCVCSPFRMDLRGLQHGADAVSARSHLPGRGRDCPLLSTSLQKY